MEQEMQTTIEGYCSVLESQQEESTGDSDRAKRQLLEQQNINESQQCEINDLKDELTVVKDENDTLKK
jgi:hypothetical protein